MGDLCDLGGQGNLYEILAPDPKKPLHMHREFVSDLADYLYTEKRFIEKPSITLKRCTVRLTPKGIEYCEQNRATFFS